MWGTGQEVVGERELLLQLGEDLFDVGTEGGVVREGQGFVQVFCCAAAVLECLIDERSAEVRGKGGGREIDSLVVVV